MSEKVHFYKNWICFTIYQIWPSLMVIWKYDNYDQKIEVTQNRKVSLFENIPMSWAINIDVIIKGQDVNIRLIKDWMMVTWQWWNIFKGKDNDIQITLKVVIIQWPAITFTMTGYLLHYGFCYVTFGGHYNTIDGQ